MRIIKEVLRLKFEAKLSQRQISRSLNIGLGTVSLHLSRAKEEGLTWPLPADMNDQQLEARLFPGSLPQIRSGHCGWGPENHLRKLYDNWNARNDKMASAIALMASVPENRPVVVIVGAGHTQYNRGVITSLHAVNPELKPFNLGLMGVHEALDQAADYSTQFELNGVNFGYPHDYLWFTEGLPDSEDLCKHYLKKKEKVKEKEKEIEQHQPNEELKNQAQEPQAS